MYDRGENWAVENIYQCTFLVRPFGTRTHAHTHTYAHKHVHTYTHTHIHTHTYIYTHTRTYTRIHTHTHIHTHKHTNTHNHTHIHIHQSCLWEVLLISWYFAGLKYCCTYERSHATHSEWTHKSHVRTMTDAFHTKQFSCIQCIFHSNMYQRHLESLYIIMYVAWLICTATHTATHSATQSLHAHVRDETYSSAMTHFVQIFMNSILSYVSKGAHLISRSFSSHNHYLPLWLIVCNKLSLSLWEASFSYIKMFERHLSCNNVS